MVATNLKMVDSNADLLLPERTRLLHIGPPKTGTTAVQSAFVLARRELGKHGVSFPSGKHRQPLRAVLSITGARGIVGQEPAKPEDWEKLRKKVSDAGNKRVLISSEFFADANDEQAARMVDELGGSDVHVVLSLRPVGRIMPSQWQQYVQNGNTTSYEDWLRGMLLEPPYDKPTPSFWRRNNHPELIERWASLVGKDRLTVIVIDESDRDMLLRLFESMLGLPTEFLKAEESTSNRSLTWGEVELLRRLNQEYKKRGWSNHFYARFVRYGGIERMRTRHSPLPTESKIVTPAWAEERAAEISADFAQKIEAMDLRVIGDLSALAARPSNSVDALPEPFVSSTAAAEALAGALGVSRERTQSSSTAPQDQTSQGAKNGTQKSANGRTVELEDRPVADVGAADLLKVVAKRVVSRVRGGDRAD